MFAPSKALLASALVFGGMLLASCGPQVPLTGVVTDAYTGKPVPDAKITLGRTELTTDANGRFQASSWSASDTLTVIAGGYEQAAVPLQNQPQLAKPTPPAVTLDTTLRPNTFSTTVTDAYTGKPIGGAVAQYGDQKVTADPAGKLVLNNVPERFSLALSAPDYAPLTKEINRQTSTDAMLRPSVLSGTLTDSYTGKPLSGAKLSIGSVSATSGADGRYRLENVPEQGELQVSAEGYAALKQPLGKSTALDAGLRPNVIKGTLLDAKSGKPIAFATVIASPALNQSAVTSVRLESSTDGAFALKDIPEQGFVQVLAPGYKKAVVELKPGAGLGEIKLEPFITRALYVNAPYASKPKAWQSYLDATNSTSINALVIDLKSDRWGDLGVVYYDSQAPLVKELKTSIDVMDIRKVIADAKARGVYTIARIHIFSHDNELAAAKPEWAGRDPEGNVLATKPTSEVHYDWLDPWNKNVWEYNKQIAVEAALLGFDEINYDYIRFPDKDPKDYRFSQPTDPINNPDAMYDNIAAFAKDAQEAINGAGAFFSIDVFGYAAIRPMWEIGQNIDKLAPYTDYIMPMIYPSHYFPGEFGEAVPAAAPYKMVYESLKVGFKRMEGTRAKLRPWLQDFTLIWQTPIVRYGVPEVKEQIRAVEEFPQQEGWAMWDPDCEYDEAAFKP